MSGGRPVDESLVERFARDLRFVAAPGDRLGLAVSGGPDSFALLLLTHAVRPRKFEVATVDHALRPESAGEASFVASVCRSLDVPHTTLKIDWPEAPATAVQNKARAARYAALGRWAGERVIASVLTGHHRDDQAETVLMRLARGAGVRGLAGMRAVAPVPGHPSIALIRPLLDWSRDELRAVCHRAGLEPVQDPSNHEESFERVRVRARLADADWLDAHALARSASHLAQADEALNWASEREWTDRVKRSSSSFKYTPAAPSELQRRVVARIVAELATEGPVELRGRELDRVMQALSSGASATLRGVLCSGGETWTFTAAPPRG